MYRATLGPFPLTFSSAEAKLGRLEGADRRGLTSKDIISSLSESRQDHLGQLVTPPPSHAHRLDTVSSGAAASSAASNDPWGNTGATPSLDSPTAIRNEFAEFDFTDVDINPESDGFRAETVESDVSPSIHYLGAWCTCCFGRRGSTYSRVRSNSGRDLTRRKGGGSSGVGGRSRVRRMKGDVGGEGEERVFLVDSDEVEQRWLESEAWVKNLLLAAMYNHVQCQL